MFTLVFIALAASAILAAIAFSIAGRNAAFNYSVDEAQVQYEKMSAVIRSTTDDLTLEEIYNYILYIIIEPDSSHEDPVSARQQALLCNPVQSS